MFSIWKSSIAAKATRFSNWANISFSPFSKWRKFSRRTCEIILVDDGSTDATVAVAELAGTRVISISRRHIAAARNTGGRAATGDVLFFVDADTRINQAHVDGAMAALQGGFSGGGARV